MWDDSEPPRKATPHLRLRRPSLGIQFLNYILANGNGEDDMQTNL
jgi:hypothetical protein